MIMRRSPSENVPSAQIQREMIYEYNGSLDAYIVDKSRGNRLR